MPNLPVELETFLTDLKQSGPRQGGRRRRIPPSPAKIQPGDVLSFDYHLKGNTFTRVELVVANSKGRGHYNNIAFNDCISCFRLNEASPVVLTTALNVLYKNRKRASYAAVKAGLKIMLGVKEYRTYRVDRLSDLRQVYIEKPDKLDVKET